MGGAIDVNAFLQYSDAERRYFTGASVTKSGKVVGLSGTPNKPYHSAFTFCLTEAVMAAKGDAIVNFVFDQNKQEAPYALQVFKEYRNAVESDIVWSKLGSVIFADHRKEPGLQAADLITHLWYSFLQNGTVGMGRERNTVFQHIKKRRDGMRVADQGYFDAGLARLTPKQRAQMSEL